MCIRDSFKVPAEEEIPKGDELLTGEYMFPDSDELWAEFEQQLYDSVKNIYRQQVASDEKKTVVIFQTDTRPPGVLNEKEIHDDLNRSGKLMHNVNKVQGWEAGLYLFLTHPQVLSRNFQSTG